MPLDLDDIEQMYADILDDGNDQSPKTNGSNKASPSAPRPIKTPTTPSPRAKRSSKSGDDHRPFAASPTPSHSPTLDPLEFVASPISETQEFLRRASASEGEKETPLTETLAPLSSSQPVEQPKSRKSPTTPPPSSSARSVPTLTIETGGSPAAPLEGKPDNIPSTAERMQRLSKSGSPEEIRRERESTSVGIVSPNLSPNAEKAIEDAIRRASSSKSPQTRPIFLKNTRRISSFALDISGSPVSPRAAKPVHIPSTAERMQRLSNSGSPEEIRRERESTSVGIVSPNLTPNAEKAIEAAIRRSSSRTPNSRPVFLKNTRRVSSFALDMGGSPGSPRAAKPAHIPSTAERMQRLSNSGSPEEIRRERESTSVGIVSPNLTPNAEKAIEAAIRRSSSKTPQSRPVFLKNTRRVSSFALDINDGAAASPRTKHLEALAKTASPIEIRNERNSTSLGVVSPNLSANPERAIENAIRRASQSSRRSSAGSMLGVLPAKLHRRGSSINLTDDEKLLSPSSPMTQRLESLTRLGSPAQIREERESTSIGVLSPNLSADPEDAIAQAIRRKSAANSAVTSPTASRRASRMDSSPTDSAHLGGLELGGSPQQKSVASAHSLIKSPEVKAKDIPPISSSALNSPLGTRILGNDTSIASAKSSNEKTAQADEPGTATSSKSNVSLAAAAHNKFVNDAITQQSSESKLTPGVAEEDAISPMTLPQESEQPSDLALDATNADAKEPKETTKQGKTTGVKDPTTPSKPQLKIEISKPESESAASTKARESSPSPSPKSKVGGTVDSSKASSESLSGSKEVNGADALGIVAGVGAATAGAIAVGKGENAKHEDTKEAAESHAPSKPQTSSEKVETTQSAPKDRDAASESFEIVDHDTYEVPRAPAPSISGPGFNEPTLFSPTEANKKLLATLNEEPDSDTASESTQTNAETTNSETHSKSSLTTEQSVESTPSNSVRKSIPLDSPVKATPQPVLESLDTTSKSVESKVEESPKSLKNLDSEPVEKAINGTQSSSKAETPTPATSKEVPADEKPEEPVKSLKTETPLSPLSKSGESPSESVVGVDSNGTVTPVKAETVGPKEVPSPKHTLETPASAEPKPARAPRDSDTVFLYVSMASGGRGGMKNMTRAETILKSYKVDYTLVEISMDDKARLLWKHRGIAKGKKLPAVVRDGEIKLDFEELLQANEDEEVDEVIFEEF